VVYLEIEKLIDAFLKEKQFLCVASPATVRIYSSHGRRTSATSVARAK
jgi:hypothetical protein